ncbi:MAG: hypothetical protein ISS72_10885 [Candidatus Brocadiae bacterium]|nr:hypothetical protein [Candidatus Brocadiia bacterium]
MGNLTEFDKRIRELTGEHVEARPFLCEGSPFGCEVFLVGINPGTSTPFWPYWRLPYGCHKQEWLRDYMSRRGRKPTRIRIERIISAAAPVRCLDTNAFFRYSPNEASLRPEDRDTRVFDYLLEVLTPKVVFAHGASAIEYFERLAGSALPYDQFTSVSVRGMRIDVITGQHLGRARRGWTYERFEELGRALRQRCQGTRCQFPNTALSTHVGNASSPDLAQSRMPLPLVRRDITDFEATWEYLREHSPLRLETSGGTRFTAHVSDTSIAYESDRDQTRTQSKDNFETYFHLWFLEGRRDRRYFRNLTKKRSPSRRFSYFSAVFRHLEEHLGLGKRR